MSNRTGTKGKCATIISVGNEILSGDVVDTNAAWLAKRLSTQGVTIERIMVVGDDEEEISEAIKNCNSDFVFVMGGLGPTHDDVTREGVANGVGRKIERNKEVERMLNQKYGISGSLLKMADMPAGSEVIVNPVGVAPGFIVGNAIVLPGMPDEMRGIFEVIASLFIDAGGIKGEEWIITDMAEHELWEIMGEAVKKFADVEIGSYPYIERIGARKEYRLRIKLQSANITALNQAKVWLKRAIEIESYSLPKI
jgi:molybdenum cofactor synthesis domain-containing protein